MAAAMRPPQKPTYRKYAQEEEEEQRNVVTRNTESAAIDKAMLT
jgi:hypothetical protein